ncbi:MAG: hypothetical protein ABWY56_11075, partial [Propionibacteriaceae bacterium]
MSPTPDMTAILEELSAGRIGAAEAARRIDALKTAETAAPSAPEPVAPVAPVPPVAPAEEPIAEPTNEDLAASASGTADGAPAEDAWAATTDRPQQATFTRESFARESDVTPDPEPVFTEPPFTQPEPPRAKPVNTGGVDRISVRAVGRRVRIVGETSVATLAADGPHVLRRNGSVLEV